MGQSCSLLRREVFQTFRALKVAIPCSLPILLIVCVGCGSPWLALFVGGILATGVRSAAVQAAKDTPAPKAKTYREMKKDTVALGQRKKEHSKVNAILRNSTFASPEERQMFEDYYQSYALPRWTWESNVPLIATDFWKDLRIELQSAKGGELVDDLAPDRHENLVRHCQGRGVSPCGPL